ncbi:MAG: hypothetical protein JSV64_03930 [Candidatus Bathyarchaeota archaeon]|nr:MAG: hypothetical protein JSV64_03930 [Candidatus Bathyarchaeota archaeon]
MRRKATILGLLVFLTCTLIRNTVNPAVSTYAASRLESVRSNGFFVLEPPSTDKVLSGIAWKPDGSCFLLTALDRHGYGSEIFKYDGHFYTLLLNDTEIIIQGVAWHPNGSYALITAHYYANQNHRYRLLRYDGDNFSTITEGGTHDMRRIAWKPDGSYALIVGGDFATGGMIWRYDGVNLTSVYDGDNSFSKFMKVKWKPDGSFALIVDFFSTIFEYNGTDISELATFDSLSIHSVSWSADGSYALITAWYNLEWEEHLVVLKFDGAEFVDVTHHVGTENRLYGASSSGTAGTLIVGTNGVVLVYDGMAFTMLTEGIYPDLRCVKWKPDGSQALIAGGGGTFLLFYMPDPLLKWNPADVNSDWIVDIYDLVIAASAYGSTPMDPNWNHYCDLSEPYREIDIFDIVTIAINYGQEYPP